MAKQIRRDAPHNGGRRIGNGAGLGNQAVHTAGSLPEQEGQLVHFPGQCNVQGGKLGLGPGQKSLGLGQIQSGGQPVVIPCPG